MVALEEPGEVSIVVEDASGNNRTTVLAPIRTSVLSATIANGRPIFGVMDSAAAQRVAPTPALNRVRRPLMKKWCPQGGHIIVTHKSDAADTEDTSDSTYNLDVVVRNLAVPLGQKGDFYAKTLTQTSTEKNTSRVADDSAFTTAGHSDRIAYKVPTGMEMLVHGEIEVIVMDDTA